MLSVIMLNVDMLSVILVRVVEPFNRGLSTLKKLLDCFE